MEWWWLNGLFGLRLRLRLGCVNNDVFDVLDALSAACTWYEVFRVRVVKVFESS